MGTSTIRVYAIFEGFESFCKMGLIQNLLDDWAALYSMGLIFERGLYTRLYSITAIPRVYYKVWSFIFGHSRHFENFVLKNYVLIKISYLFMTTVKQCFLVPPHGGTNYWKS